MSRVRYEAQDRSYYIEVDGLDDVAQVLQEVAKKTPDVAKNAINATATKARKLMIAQAKARYAVNAAGLRQLKKLQRRKRASNSSLYATMDINTPKNDLGYFQSRPSVPLMGRDVARAPEYFRGRVLKSSPMTELTGQGNLSKGFLVEFKSGHVGMVQRIIGSKARATVTARGYPRWTNAQGNVEKLQTMGSPSASAMHNTIWHEVEPEIELFLLDRLQSQAEATLRKARAKRGI